MYSHKSILEYLKASGFTKTYEQFKEEAPGLVSKVAPRVASDDSNCYLRPNMNQTASYPIY